MAEDRSVQEILDSWNKPPVDSGFDLVVGVQVPEGDGRATASVDHKTLGHAGDDEGGDFDRIDEDYDDYTVPHLKHEIAARNAERADEDDHIVFDGKPNKADLVSALEDDDEEQGE